MGALVMLTVKLTNYRQCLVQTFLCMDHHVLDTLHELVSMVYEEDPKLKVCTQKPTGVQTFASFIIDLKCVNLKDLAADDNGVWVTSMPCRMYELKWKQGVVPYYNSMYQ